MTDRRHPPTHEAGAVQTDASHAVNTTAVGILPPSVRARYPRDCARWRTIYDHHRYIVGLLREVRS